MKTTRDETLEEIWAIRRKLAQQFNYDPKKAAEYYQRKQKELGGKIYHSSTPTADILHDRASAEINLGKSASSTSYSAKRKLKAKRGK